MFKSNYKESAADVTIRQITVHQKELFMTHTEHTK